MEERLEGESSRIQVRSFGVVIVKRSPGLDQGPGGLVAFPQKVGVGP